MAAATSNGINSGSSAAPAKQRVGVADYFAILGVGENLIWKHAQHKASSSQPEVDTISEESQGSGNSGMIKPENTSNTGGNAPSNGSVTTDIPEEDDAMLLERFYREIIHVDIVLAQERLEPQQKQPHLGESESLNTSTTAASTTTVLYTSQPPLQSALTYPHQHQQTPQLNQAFSWDTAYTSATARSCTSAAPAILTVQNTLIGNKTVADVEIQEGWTVVQKTRPAATNPMGGSAHHYPVEDPIVWKKGQILDANLDPMGGSNCRNTTFVSTTTAANGTFAGARTQ